MENEIEKLQRSIVLKLLYNFTIQASEFVTLFYPTIFDSNPYFGYADNILVHRLDQGCHVWWQKYYLNISALCLQFTRKWMARGIIQKE